MFEYINSEYTKNRYETAGFKLTDFNKATVIWNNKTMLYEEKLEALEKLKKKTLDIKLKKQIKERLEYEKMILARFKNHSDNEIIYVVKDYQEEGIYGLFSKFETALEQSKNIGIEYDCNMTIEKHLVVTGDSIPKVRSKGRWNSNLFPDTGTEYEQYDGSAIAAMNLNKTGDILSFWSYELSQEEKAVDEYDKDRFECKFFAVPYIHHKGLPVKNDVTGEYGILATDKEEWDSFIGRVKNGIYVDYSDIVHTVYCLKAEGYWSHQHWNPMDMETEMPFTSDFTDVKSWAFVRALDALSEYMSGHTDEAHIRLVLETTKEYKDACKEKVDFVKPLSEAVNVEDILC